MSNQKITYSDLPLLNRDIIENVQQLIEHGADKVELMMDGDKWDDMELLFEPVAKQLNELSIPFSIHPPAWDINLTSENKAIRNASFNEYKKSIEFAGMVGASHVVIHPGFCFSPAFNKKQAQQRASVYIKELCGIAKPLNVHLAIENVGYNGTALFTEEEFVHFLDDIDETAGYLIDVGHAQLDGWDVPRVIKTIKGRLLALHLHDNMGSSDDHLPIGTGKMDWENVFDTLHEQQIDCDLILEYAPGTSLETLRTGKDFLSERVFAR
ncbi:sugar phosphate isomerase/epimerase family protein [Oceanobacillus damuensis]|uniref:sugar phosphate isomerase/epimerase family protein n=1 Tax=Oceanobacillus damuensis TaxID=937928 RepID=UPI000832C8FD|nr:sugar phosphate isomerase/epimerase family protein [Oceanobacillus damuensis]